jgi:predicted nucleotidyltransferase
MSASDALKSKSAGQTESDLILNNDRIRPEIKDDMRRVVEITRQTTDCLKMYLFGSYAYGQPHPDSDYDIYVVVPDGAGRPRDLAVNIRQKLHLNKVRKSFDIIVHHQSKFLNLSPLASLIRVIVQKGVLIYDQQ